MHPPAEQLIRDYLNKVSVAARSRLSPSERQQLLDRTRARIEASVGGISAATSLKVRRVLADLGDPVALVEGERAKYEDGADGPSLPGHYAIPLGGTAVPGGGAAGQAVQVRPATVVTLPLDHGVPGGGAAGPVVAASAAFSGAVVTASSEVGTGTGSAGGSERTGPRTDRPDSATAADRSGGPAVTARSARAERRLRGKVLPPRPGEASDGSGASGSSSSRFSLRGAALGLPLPRQAPPDERIDAAATPPVAAEEAGYGRELFFLSASRLRRAADLLGGGLAATARGLGSQLVRIGHSLLALAVRDKLETLAIVLLGVGGAVYPPVWIAGALLALISPKWDLRDKLLGLVLPGVLVVFGAVMVVALGGARATLTQYGLEGWLAAGRLARVGAVIGAGYLLRRVYRGPRAPKPPPWSRPRGER